MPRNGSGTYSLPAGNPVVTATDITVSWGNGTMNDIATALTGSIARDGQSPPTANLPMGGYKLTGLAAGANNGDSVRFEQVLDSSGAFLSAIGAGTNSSGIIGSNVTTGTLGSLKWAHAKPVTLVAGGGTAYSVNASQRHDLTIGSAQLVSFNFNGGDTFTISNDTSNTYLYGQNASLYLGTTTSHQASILTNNTFRHDYYANGIQRCDGQNQQGQMEQVFYPRIIAINSDGNTTITQAGTLQTISCSRPATGQYNYTIAGRVAGSQIYVTGNATTAGNIMTVNVTGSTTFTVNLRDAANTAVNDFHTLSIFWG